MLVVGRREQQLGAVRGAAGDDDDVAREHLDRAVAIRDDARDGPSARVRVEPQRPRCGSPASRCRARAPAARRAPRRRPSRARGTGTRRTSEHRMQRLCGMSCSASITPHGAWNGCSPAAARSSESCWMRGSWLTAGNGIRRARGRLGGILAARAVDLVELLGARVVRLHLVVADRPRGREPVVVAQLPEVLRAQAVQRGAVELGRAAHAVVHLRLKRLPATRRTTCPARRSGCPRTRPATASSAARAAASRRAPAAGCAGPTPRAGAPACRRPRRCRSR